MNEELYTLLGVDKQATIPVIKAAYRRLAQLHHPDRGGDPEHFIEISKAYQTLMDPELKRAYDLSGEIRQDNVLAMQKSMVASIASAFEKTIEIALEQGAAIENVFVIETMKQMTSEALQNEIRQEDATRRKLEAFHRLRNRIKRRGEEKNLFAEIIEKRILELSAELKDTSRNVRLVRMCLDEISRHEDVASMIRTVQMTMYPGAGTGGGFFGNITFGS